MYVSYFRDMEDKRPYGVLTDAERARLAPLIEAVRPQGKTKPPALRRTVEAIISRHNNGAKWRAIPAELGPWWMATQTLIRSRGRASGSGSSSWCRSVAVISG
jgi:transposase